MLLEVHMQYMRVMLRKLHVLRLQSQHRLNNWHCYDNVFMRCSRYEL